MDDPAVTALGGESTSAPANPKGNINRTDLRKGQSQFGSHINRLVMSGAHYIASFEDHEEGVAAGRKIMPELVDEPLHHIYTTRIVPAAGPFRRIKQAARTTAEEVRQVATIQGEAGVEGRYTLVKALGYTRYADSTLFERQKARVERPEPEFALALLYGLQGEDIHKQLLSELHAGDYDWLIARDILHFIDHAQEVKGDLAKIQQLVGCVYFMCGQPTNTAAFYDRMLDGLETWPDAQRQVILESRIQLRERLEKRLSTVTQALRTDAFIVDDPEQAFAASFNRFGDALLRRAEVTPANKAQIIQLRADMKRGRVVSRRDQRRASRRGENETEEVVTAETDTVREPAKLVVCNLATYAVEDDPTAMIDAFVTATSQGNVTVREDLQRILNHMARRDLPETRRGFKNIQESRVKFGTPDDPDRLWDFEEFKPTEAAGLSLRTDAAKNCRVYCIRLDSDTIGIIGIAPRSQQDIFLKKIRVKTKRRG